MIIWNLILWVDLDLCRGLEWDITFIDDNLSACVVCVACVGESKLVVTKKRTNSNLGGETKDVEEIVIIILILVLCRPHLGAASRLRWKKLCGTFCVRLNLINLKLSCVCIWKFCEHLRRYFLSYNPLVELHVYEFFSLLCVFRQSTSWILMENFSGIFFCTFSSWGFSSCGFVGVRQCVVCGKWLISYGVVNYGK